MKKGVMGRGKSAIEEGDFYYKSVISRSLQVGANLSFLHLKLGRNKNGFKKSY